MIWGMNILFENGQTGSLLGRRDEIKEAYQRWREAKGPGGLAESLIEVEGFCDSAKREATNFSFVADSVVSITIWEEA